MGIELVPGPKDSDIEWDAKKEFIRSLEDATGEVSGVISKGQMRRRSRPNI